MTSEHALNARRRKRDQAEGIGIDPEFIELMVSRFYARVRADAVLGPIFADRIDDWPKHLARMCAFWGSVLHESGGFAGNPMLKHVAIPGIGRPEFRRWLDLFAATLVEIERNPAATQAIHERAGRIADSLLCAIAIHRDGETDPGKWKGLHDA